MKANRKKLLGRAGSVVLSAALLFGSAAAVPTVVNAGGMVSETEPYISIYAVDENGFMLFDEATGYPVSNYTIVGGEKTDTLEGVTYDSTANTLELNNFKHGNMVVVAGNTGADFKIKVTGECELARINISAYSGRSTKAAKLGLTGSGVLTVNSNKLFVNGLSIYANYNEGAVSFGENVSVRLYGSENAAAIYNSTAKDADSAFSFANDYKTNIIKDTITEEEHIDGIFMQPSGTYIDIYKATLTGDSENLYGVQKLSAEENDGREGCYRIRKYEYVKRFDAYYCDYSQDEKILTEQEMKDAGYTIETEKLLEEVHYHYPEEENISDSRYYSGYRVIKPGDPDSIYVMPYVYGKAPNNKNVSYPLRKLKLTDGVYSVDTSFEEIYVNDAKFAEAGYTYVLSAGTEAPVSVECPVPDQENSYYNGYLVNDPADPDGIYMIDESFASFPDDNYYQLSKVVYDEARKAYFLDRSAEQGGRESYSKDTFEQAGLSYVWVDSPVGLPAYSTYHAGYVYVDMKGDRFVSNGSSYNKQWYTYDENDKLTINGSDFYALTPATITSEEDMNVAMITYDDCFNYTTQVNGLVYDGVAETPVTPQEKPATKVKLNKTTLSVNKGKTATLKATLTPADSTDKVTWKSSDTKIATVDKNGKITAKKVGTATITATAASGKKATCKVTVKSPATKIKLNKTTLSVNKGKTAALKTTVTPSDSTDKLTWKSSNTKIATVDSKGKITAKKVGTATITVTTASGKKATCKVTVKSPATKVKLSKTKATLKVGKSLTLKATLTPKDCTDKVTWTTSNRKIAIVNAKGKVTAKKAGKVTITAKAASGKTAKCTMTVKKK